MKKTKLISKTIEKYDGDWPPINAEGFIGWFQAKLGDVPEEFRSTAHIKVDCVHHYDSNYATIEFCYTREETDDEEAVRKQQVAAYEESNRARELRLLAELQAKYGVSDE
jgi:hypothetical protein